MSELLTFQRFNDIGVANEFAEKLKQLGIQFSLENESAPFDISFANNPLEDDIRIKLLPQDFITANAALDEYYKSLVDNVDTDHYLLQFTNDELMDVIEKPDEWNRFDYQLSLKLLKERGIEVNPAVIQSRQKEHIAELSKSEKIPWLWVCLGYVTAFLGGLFGVCVGLLLIYAKKTLPNGQTTYIYTENQRSHGKIILALSITCTILWFLGVLHY